ncbi:MAG: RDD family protein, partial [Thermoanaerobaculia bacterium]
GRATGRHFSKILSTLILFIGFLMVAFSEKKQGLHDRIAETLVVRD